VTSLGFEGDQQNDSFHGGPGRAVLHYALENYETLKTIFDGMGSEISNSLRKFGQV
jgi:MOSC domain-containing protein YiiM